jgi:hypothetical protein
MLSAGCRAVTYHGRIIVYGGAVVDDDGAKARLGDVYSLVVRGSQLCWSQCDSPAPCRDMPRSEHHGWAACSDVVMQLSVLLVCLVHCLMLLSMCDSSAPCRDMPRSEWL